MAVIMLTGSARVISGLQLLWGSLCNGRWFGDGMEKRVFGNWGCLTQINCYVGGRFTHWSIVTFCRTVLECVHTVHVSASLYFILNRFFVKYQVYYL